MEDSIMTPLCHHMKQINVKKWEVYTTVRSILPLLK